MIADSSMIGLPAERHVKSICTDLRTDIRSGMQPKRALKKAADTHMRQDINYAPVLYVEISINRGKGKMSVYCAGHDPPIHIASKTHKSRRLRRVSNISLPIGVDDLEKGPRLYNGRINCTRAYEPQVAAVKMDDTIALFSDGLTDALDDEHQDMGRERLERLLVDIVRRQRRTRPADIVGSVFARLDPDSITDDTTLLVARIR